MSSRETSSVGPQPPDPALEPLEAYLRQQVVLERTDRAQLQGSVRFPADLQGPPDVAHGGAITAMLLELVRLHRESRGESPDLEAAVEVEVALHRSLPVGRPAHAESAPVADGWASRLVLDGRTIAEATLRPGVLRGVPDTMATWHGAGAEPQLVPGYADCFGCGFRNPRGAQVRFAYDDEWIWQDVVPGAHFRAGDGTVALGYLALVSDELGWWLGALRQGECGVSNRLRLVLRRTRAARLLVLGSRRGVVSRDVRGRLWQADTLVLTSDGEPVASASVQFAGSPAFTKLMLPGFALPGDTEAVRRAFPRSTQGASQAAGE